jgi:4-diphosphocytidyl-2-C-methyl-D-erythritol kinase
VRPAWTTTGCCARSPRPWAPTAQVRPARYLATGAGEDLRALPDPPAYGVLVLPADARLSTADVYRAADRLGLPRAPADLRERVRVVRERAADLPDELVVNDLEPAARALCPAVAESLAAARGAGADHALVCGSGPTVVGLFRRLDAARGAAVALAGRRPRPFVAEPWRAPAREVAA